MAIADAVLTVIEDQKLQQHALEVGSYLLARFKELQSQFPQWIGDVRYVRVYNIIIEVHHVHNTLYICMGPIYVPCSTVQKHCIFKAPFIHRHHDNNKSIESTGTVYVAHYVKFERLPCILGSDVDICIGIYANVYRELIYMRYVVCN